MAKRILLSVCIFLVVFSMAFAGGGQGASSGITKIGVWTNNTVDKDIRTQQIERFNAGRGKDLGIEINYTSWGSAYPETLRIALMAGDAPELFRPDTYTADYINAGQIIPIETLEGGQALIDRYKPYLVDNKNVFNGKTYVIPFSLTTYKFLINKDLWDAAGLTDYPKNWAEVRAAAKVLTEKGNGESFGYILGLRTPTTITSYITRPNGVNTGNIGFDHEALRYDFSANLPVIEAIQGMMADGSTFPGCEGLDMDQARAQFAAGRVGMTVGFSADVAVYNRQFPANFNWVVIDMPADSPAGPEFKETIDTTYIMAVGKLAEKQPVKAGEVYTFLHSDENMVEFYENGIYMPVRTEIMSMATRHPDQMRGFAEFGKLPVGGNIILWTPESEIAVEGMLYRETLVKLLSGGFITETAAQVLADIDRRYNEAFMKLPQAKREVFRNPSSRDIRR